MKIGEAGVASSLSDLGPRSPFPDGLAQGISSHLKPSQPALSELQGLEHWSLSPTRLSERTCKNMAHLPNLIAEAVAGQHDLGLRGMWLAIIVLAATLAALVAAVLTWVAKRQPPTAGPSVAIDNRPVAAAMLYMGVAFGGTITVLLGIYSAGGHNSAEAVAEWASGLNSCIAPGCPLTDFSTVAFSGIKVDGNSIGSYHPSVIQMAYQNVRLSSLRNGTAYTVYFQHG
jgi:hypothetical protein